MRIKLTNPSLFIDEITYKSRLNIKDFSKKHNINYSNLKQWRRGEKTFPDKVFKKLLIYSPRKNYWKSNAEILNDNWGNKKGGENSNRKNNGEKRMKYARKFRKITEVNIRLNKNFCEFYGALLGDGCISKYKDKKNNEKFVIMLSGNKKLDWKYWRYLKELLSKEYGLYSYYYEYKDKNSCVLFIRNKCLCLELNNNFKFPIGIKYRELKIDKKIIDLDWEIKKLVIRGLFDTDGSVYGKRNESYKYPIISIKSKKEGFLQQIKDLLNREGYPAYISGENVSVRGKKNINRWFSDIGSSNERNIKKYEYWRRNKFLPPNILGS